MALYRLHRILRAGWHEAAGVRQHGRNPSFVQPQSELHCLFHLASSFRYSRALCGQPQASRATSFTSSQERHRRISLTPELNTISTGPSHAATESLTASRIRRLMRLRSTAPPSTLPTVKPSPGPGDRLISTPPGKTLSCFSRELPASVLDTRAENRRVSTTRCFDLGNLLLAGELLPDIQCPSPTCRNVHFLRYMVGYDPLQFHRKAEFPLLLV